MENQFIEINIDAIPIGRRLDFTLRSQDGTLLANKGYVINSKEELFRLKGKDIRFMIDIKESFIANKAYFFKINKMIQNGENIDNISHATLSSLNFKENNLIIKEKIIDWIAYKNKLSILLTYPKKENFLIKLEYIYQEISFYINKNSDATLTELIYLTYYEKENYSAMHSLLVCAISVITARKVLKWDEKIIEDLGKAALTMNISMTSLQDQLVNQNFKLNSEQILIINNHAEDSKKILEYLGVKSENWLEGVAYHRKIATDDFFHKSICEKIGRLLQRCDILSARLAPRKNRQTLPINLALQASYLNEIKQPDEFGVSIVKALGLYAPGAYVQLINQEIGIVVKRVVVRPGIIGNSPIVIGLLNKEGLPFTNFVLRDTSQESFKIIKAISSEQIKNNFSINKVLLFANKYIY